ncbi:MAG: hypothetical protein HYZ29_33555 [Myxococcales bacterium]|nr:hypothetical protein [Myxococcales bacterium]
MRKLSLWLVPWLALACAAQLPSATPLGEGPLAKAEALAAAKALAAREAKAKGKPGPPVTPPPPAPVAPPPVAPPPSATAEAPKPGAPAPKSPGAKPTAVVVYAGEYVGSDTSVYKMAGTERSEKDDKARTRVDGSGAEIAVSFIDSGTGKDICTLKAKTNGKTASFTAGQKCWGNDGPGMTGTLTQGTATFEDKKLTIDADFDIEVGGGESFSMSGKLHYHFEGARK